MPQKNRNETQLKPFAFPSVQGGCLNQPQQRGLELGPGLVWTSEELERDVDLTLTVAEITRRHQEEQRALKQRGPDYVANIRQYLEKGILSLGLLTGP